MECPSCRDNPVKYNKEQVEAYAKEYDKELEKDFEKKEVRKEKKDEELIEDFPEDLEDLNPEKIIVKDHFQGPIKEVCGYCNKDLKSENCITKTINGIKYEFCSEECIEDFMDALHFKDEEL